MIEEKYDHSTTVPQLSALTLQAVRAESIRAHMKHRDKSMLSTSVSDLERLAALAEEFGEVAELLTYDKRLAAGDDWKDMIVKELIQVGNVALSWAQAIDSPSPKRKPECANCSKSVPTYWISSSSISMALARRNTETDADNNSLVWCSDTCYDDWQALQQQVP